MDPQDPILCALLDQLVDVRCAIDDGLLAYARECAVRAEILARSFVTPQTVAGKNRAVADLLGKEDQ